MPDPTDIRALLGDLGQQSTPNKYDALVPPNLDLDNRPYVKTWDPESGEEGTSTVRSMGVNFDGDETLLPTVSNDGWIMEPDEAIAEYRKTGQHMGVYPSIEASDRAGEGIHQEQMTRPPRPTMHRIQTPPVKIEGTVPKPEPKPDDDDLM